MSDLFQLLNAEDVSGLRVTSSERVAVVVAVDAIDDVVVTQLPPVNHWHTHYLQTTTHTLPAAHSFRVLGIDTRTHVNTTLATPLANSMGKVTG